MTSAPTEQFPSAGPESLQRPCLNLPVAFPAPGKKAAEPDLGPCGDPKEGRGTPASKQVPGPHLSWLGEAHWPWGREPGADWRNSDVQLSHSEHASPRMQ